MMIAQPTPDDVQRVLAHHVPLYRGRRPLYQTTLLQSLAALWDPENRRVLDVGGGTGLIAQAVRELLPVREIIAVDIKDRFLPTLTIPTMTFDGSRLPFASHSFDCVTLNNVLHHVPAEARASLIAECRRVAGDGPIYIKDHIATSSLDHLRLKVLDWIGNIPFGGMVEAQYLGEGEWETLRTSSQHRLAAVDRGVYRRGLLAALFPNRLEVLFKWTPA